MQPHVTFRRSYKLQYQSRIQICPSHGPEGFPSSCPKPKFFKRKDPKSACTIGGASGDNNTDIERVGELQLIVPSNCTITAIKWVHKDVGCGHHVAGTTNNGSSAKTPNELISLSPSNDRKNTLLHEKVCRTERSQHLMYVLAWRRGHKLHVTFKHKIVGIKAWLRLQIEPLATSDAPTAICPA